MKIYKNIVFQKARDLLRRPSEVTKDDTTKLEDQVRKILNRVKIEGDVALRELTEKHDGVSISDFKVHDSEIEAAVSQVSEDLKKAILTAKNNIEKFHQSQIESSRKIETMPGVICWRESRPIENVGLYIPGGSAPLISTVLMLGVPANLAGCQNVVLCSPPDKQGQIHPAILYAAALCNIRNIYRVGGSQAVGAMAYGTETVPKVDKIFGPGNQYVTQAKLMIQSHGIAIDMPAGPSEVLVWADDSANPKFVAADLLAQAEHGPDSQVVLICESEEFAEQTKKWMNELKTEMSRESIIDQALKNSVMLVAARELAERLINEYAPEHLIIQRNKRSYSTDDIQNAGSVFIGPFSPESAGDYASGTNHTLPTNGAARMYSGVSLDSFVKKITFQELSYEGLQGLESVIRELANAEELDAHRLAVEIRLD